MPIEPHTEQFMLRLSPTELAMLRAVSQATGLTAADILRTCIRHEYAERFGDRKPPMPKK